MSAYDTGFAHQHSYKKLYMILDNGTLTFTADPHEVSMSNTIPFSNKIWSLIANVWLDVKYARFFIDELH